MVLRAAFFLSVVSALAFFAFQALVRSEVERVVGVHVLDKSDHLVDMYNAIPGAASITEMERFASGEFAEFASMARAVHVKSVRLYGPDGRVIDQTKPLLEVMEEGASASHHHGHTHSHGEAKPTAEAFTLLAGVPPLDSTTILTSIGGSDATFTSIQEMQDSQGQTINFAHTALPLTNAAGEIIGFLGFVVNVSHVYEVYANGVARFGMLFMVCGIILFGVPAFAFWLQKQLAEKSTRDAKYLSRHDPLTGLLNRNAFKEIGARRLAENDVGVAGYIDVDRFKLINDTFGHAVGDAYLRHLAKLIREHFDQNAVVCRLGGDEFVFTLARMAQDRRNAVIKNLMEAAAEDFHVNGVTISTSISMGVAVPEHGDTLDALLQRADTALYFSKSGGRNAVSFYDAEMGVAAERRRGLELRLREAIKNELFDVYYQPLVDAKTDRTVGYEALLRLNAEDGTPISPAEFIPLAEEIGLIEDIGRFVLRTATREIASLDNTSKVSVNLSPDQLRSGQIVQYVQEALEAAGLEAHRLELEITESVLLEDGSQTGFQIDALKDLGVSIAMDDFGTGFSSLSALWRFDFDRIKIDRSFVEMLEGNQERSSQLIDTIVLMGERMNMSITAEGVETKSQKELLSGLGCHVLQGYYFGVPQPLEQIQETAVGERAS